MRESPIETHLKKKVMQAGGHCYKWVSPGSNGVPDRLVFFPDMIFLIETKSTIGKARETQLFQHRRLAALGFPVVILNSKELVDEWVAMQYKAIYGNLIGKIASGLSKAMRVNAEVSGLEELCQD